MSEKRFELDRIGIFDNKTNHFYYKTFDNEEVCDLLNELSDTVEALILDRNKQEEKLEIARRNMTKQLEKIDEQQATIKRLERKLDYEVRMHKRWKEDCLAILEEQELEKYMSKIQKRKKSGWDSEPNTDFITKANDGINKVGGNYPNIYTHR